MTEVAITMRCKMCHLLCDKQEADTRLFHTGKCASCGGELELFSAETMPDPPVPAPMKSNGEIIIDRFGPLHVEKLPSKEKEVELVRALFAADTERFMNRVDEEILHLQSPPTTQSPSSSEAEAEESNEE